MKKYLTKKNIFIGVGGLFLILLLIAIVISYIGSEKITDLERLKIEDTSKETMAYFYELDLCDSNEIDKYINYAIEYNYNENNISSTTSIEVYDIIKSKFNLDINKEDIISIGITPCILEKNITYDFDNDTFTIHKEEQTYLQIAEQPIYDYLIKKINKVNNKTYQVTYEKYIIKNPYEILNYYMNLNTENNDTPSENNEKYDVEEINKYLKGEASLKTLKKHLNDELVREIADKEKEIVVTYKVIKDSVIVESYK